MQTLQRRWEKQLGNAEIVWIRDNTDEEEFAIDNMEWNGM